MDIVSNHHVQMPPTTIIDLIDRERSGKVSEQIHAWRTEGLSIEEITFRLREDGIPLSSKTLTRWLKGQVAS